jgi:MFS transporter, Spinster family, sphingosine-1-phosphate transporter
MNSQGLRRQRDAYVALAILSVINFLNYIDRYVVPAVFEPVKRELHFSDAQLGWIASAFMISYALTSPLFGRMGDLFTRKYLIAAGISIWSFATAGAGLARSFWQMFLPRSFVGIGEASYATVAPAIITDYYDEKRRGRALAVFYAAIPAGSAMGFVLGGMLSNLFGWRAAFFVVGLPGLLFALLALAIREPRRGAADGITSGERPATLLATYGMLARNRLYIWVTLGYVAYTFALGGMVSWMPAFMERYNGMTTARANEVFGTMTVISGFLGTFAGGFLGDYLLRYTKNSYLWVSGLCMFAGAPISVVALIARTPSVFLPAIFCAEFFLFLNTGPINAVILNSVPAEIRATAMAVNIFFIHALGDVISPPLIGSVSDQVGLLRAAMIAPGVMVVSGVLLLWAIKQSPGRQ